MFSSTIDTKAVENLKVLKFEGRICVVESLGQDFDKAIEHLKKQVIIGFDTETKPCFVANAPRNKTALLQLSAHSVTYLFRLTKIGLPSSLLSILEDPSIIKVGVAVNDDINGLRRCEKFIANSFIDLQKIAAKFGIEERSVKKLTAIILGYKISKTQQLSNWESATLSPSQLQYAAIDAWVCREMYIKLMQSK